MILNSSILPFMNMIIQNMFVLGVLVLLAALLAVYKFFIKPFKNMKWQAKSFRDKGYKVLEMPFSIIDPPPMMVYDKSGKFEDSLEFVKNNYPKYDVVVMNLLNEVLVELVNPDLVKSFLAPDKLNTYPKDRKYVDVMERAIGKGIAFSEGHEWKKKRKVLSEIFNFQFISNLSPKIAQICDKAIERLEKSTQTSDPKCYEYYVMKYTVDMAANAMITCFFGDKFETQIIEGKHISLFLNRLLNDMSLQCETILFPLFGLKFFDLGLREQDREINRRIQLYRKWLQEKVTRRVEEIKKELQHEDKKAQGEVEDLLKEIVRNMVSVDDDSVYTEEAIFEEFSTFFVGGVDTTAHYLMMMIYLTSQHPEIEAKARQEIEEFMSTDDYSYENLKNLTYIECIEKETSRYYGPVNGIFVRIAQEDNFINNVAVKKGTNVLYQSLGAHYNEKYYKDPFEFRPERWISECDNVPTYAIGGFHGGARTCLGKHFAKMEAKIGYVKFLKRYKKITLPDEKIKMISEFLYRPVEFKTKLYVE